MMMQMQMERIRGGMVTGLFVGAALMLVACGSGKTMVMEPGREPIKAQSIAINEGRSTVACPPEVIARFRTKLDEKLFKLGGFAKGDDITLTYQFVQYNPGSQFARWALGGLGNTGEGSITVQAIYSDRSGNQVGKIMSEGKIGSGLFGGSMDLAIEQAAEEVSHYTIATFK